MIKLKNLIFFFCCNLRINFKKISLFKTSFNFGIYVLKRNFVLVNKNLLFFFIMSFNLSIKNLINILYVKTFDVSKRFYALYFSWRLIISRYFKVLYGVTLSLKMDLPLIQNSKNIIKNFDREDIVNFVATQDSNEDELNLDFFYHILGKKDFYYYYLNYFQRRRFFLLQNIFTTKIRTTRNNIFFTFSFFNGKTLVTMSAGRAGFNGKQKRTPLAAKKSALKFTLIVKDLLLRHNTGDSLFIIKLNGSLTSSLFKESLTIFKDEKLPCHFIVDSNSVPHSKGVRLKKPRRV